MMGSTHATTGAAAWLAATPLLDRWLGIDPTAPQVAAGAALAAGAAILPDLDHPGGSAARSLGPPTRLTATILAKVSGGHRNGTHSLLGVAVFTAAAWAATFTSTAVPVAVAAGLLTLFAAAGVTSAPLPVRGALAAAGAAAAYLWPILTGPALPHIVAVGCLAHIAGDCLTRPGCPLLWPLSQANLSVPVVDTGGWSEKWVATPAAVAGLAVAGVFAFTT